MGSNQQTYPNSNKPVLKSRKVPRFENASVKLARKVAFSAKVAKLPDSMGFFLVACELRNVNAHLDIDVFIWLV